MAEKITLFRRAALGLTVGFNALAVLLAPSMSPGQEAPEWRVSVAGGYSPSRYGDDRDGSALPVLSVGRGFDSRLVLSLQIGRLAYGGDDGDRSSFVPVGIGVKFYPWIHVTRHPSVFAKIVPILAASRWEDTFGNAYSELSPGVMESVGLGVTVSSRTRVELEVGYVLTRGATEVYLDSPPTRHEGLDQGVVSLTVEFLMGR
jgi:hypothetical protein